MGDSQQVEEKAPARGTPDGPDLGVFPDNMVDEEVENLEVGHHAQAADDVDFLLEALAVGRVTMLPPVLQGPPGQALQVRDLKTLGHLRDLVIRRIQVVGHRAQLVQQGPAPLLQRSEQGRSRARGESRAHTLGHPSRGGEVIGVAGKIQAPSGVHPKHQAVEGGLGRVQVMGVIPP